MFPRSDPTQTPSKCSAHPALNSSPAVVHELPVVWKTVKGQLQCHCYSASIEALKWETIELGVVEGKKKKNQKNKYVSKALPTFKIGFQTEVVTVWYKMDCRSHFPSLDGLINFKLKTS